MRVPVQPVSGLAVVSVLLVCTLVALAACGGKSQQIARNPQPDSSQPPVAPQEAAARPLVETEPQMQPGLPDMDELLASKAAAAVDDDRFRRGSDYAGALGSSRVTADGDSLSFNPQYGAVSRQPADTAYALFELQLGALSGTQPLHLHWDDEPKDYDNLFVAVSNFSQGRWNWVQGLDAPLELADVADYRAGDGRTFVAVLLLGTQSAQLAWLRSGGNLPPAAVLISPAPTGSAPYQLPLDASGSSDPDGSIVRYDYDLNNDSVFEQQNRPAVSSFLVPNPPGIYTCRVQVTDDSGAVATASLEFTILPGGAPPSARLLADYVYAHAPYTANLDASSSIVPNGAAKFEWDLDGDGSYETDTGLVPAAQASIPAGSRTVRLRVTDTNNMIDIASVECFGAAPGYDEVEDNDTPETGNQISTLGIRDFEGNLGDTGSFDGDLEDFYRVVISEPMSVQFNMYFAHAEADLDMRLLDTDGTTQLGSSSSVTDSERITYSFSTPGAYFIRCFRYGTTPSSTDYTLDFKRLLPPQVSLGADVTSGDAPLAVNFTAAASDPDGAITGFTWDLNGDGTFELNTGTVPSTGTVYTSGGTRTVAVRATDNDGASSTAQIEITAFVNYDEVEDNDSPAQAQALPAANFENFFGNIGAGGPNDGDVEDWYRFNAAAGQQLACVLGFDSSASELDLRLYGTDGSTVLLTSAGADDDEFVMFTAASAGTYYLQVYYKNSTSKLAPVDYTLSLFQFVLNETEPNETPAGGNVLPALPFSFFGGNMGADSGTQEPYDWYRLDISAAGARTIWLRFIDDDCDIDCRLYAPDGTTVLGLSVNTDNDERISYTFTEVGGYYLQVYNYALGPADYVIQGR